MSFLENAETDLEVVGKKLVGEEDKKRANDWYFTSVKIKMSDKTREKQMYGALKSKYVGLGDADTTRKEFISNVRRDTYASLIGHDSLLEHLSVGLNKPKQIVRHEMIDKMARS